jgi:hypothetical protein
VWCKGPEEADVDLSGFAEGNDLACEYAALHACMLLLLLLLLLLLTILLPAAAGVLRMKGQPVMAMVAFCLLFKEPSNVRASSGVPFSRMAPMGGRVGELRFLSRRISLLLIRYTTCRYVDSVV